eukprot:gene4134-307_t
MQVYGDSFGDMASKTPSSMDIEDKLDEMAMQLVAKYEEYHTALTAAHMAIQEGRVSLTRAKMDLASGGCAEIHPDCYPQTIIPTTGVRLDLRDKKPTFELTALVEKPDPKKNPVRWFSLFPPSALPLAQQKYDESSLILLGAEHFIYGRKNILASHRSSSLVHMKYQTCYSCPQTHKAFPVSPGISRYLPVSPATLATVVRSQPLSYISQTLWSPRPAASKWGGELKLHPTSDTGYENSLSLYQGLDPVGTGWDRPPEVPKDPVGTQGGSRLGPWYRYD